MSFTSIKEKFDFERISIFFSNLKSDKEEEPKIPIKLGLNSKIFCMLLSEDNIINQD